jgi:cytochrome c oxidase subunit 4
LDLPFSALLLDHVNAQTGVVEENSMDKKQSEHGHPAYGLYVLTWLALLVLTALTVTVAGMHLGRVSVLTALVIASIKAGVVLNFFMHLKYESALFKIMVYVALGTLAIFIGLTFFDVLFR